jgi:peptide/nickel transport system substrate-binding protein
MYKTSLRPPNILLLGTVLIALLLGSVMFAQEPNRGGTLVVGFNAEPSSLAPWRSGDTNTHRVYSAIYETLVGQYETLEIMPGLAESWEVSEDGTVYTFDLREGITFHNGEEFNAEVARWNVDRWINAPDGYINRISGVASTEVVDDYTLQVTLAAPNNRFLIDLASGLRSILPPQAVEERGEDFSFNPVGTGPFMFERWISDSEIALVRNPNYWRTDENGEALPYLDGIVFRTLPDASTRHTSLITGEIDLDTTISPENVADLESRDEFVVYNEPGVGYMGLRMLMTESPFDDVRVRQAVSWAIDRESINQAAFFGLATTGSGMYSPPTPGYEEDYDPYSPRDLERARQLLTEAGYPNGFSMDIVVAVPLFQIVAEVLQAQLAEVGINVNIQSVERGTFLDGIVSREWQAYVDSLTARVDPYDYYSHLECDAVYNGHDYCNEQVDQMALRDGLANFTEIMDPERIALYEEAHRMVMDEAPLAVILYPPTLYAWHTNIHDLAINPAGRVFYFDTWKE